MALRPPLYRAPGYPPRRTEPSCAGCGVRRALGHPPQFARGRVAFVVGAAICGQRAVKGSESRVMQGRRSVVIVVKFGGTSLAGVERMRAAARIVAAHRRDQMVVCVVSAMAGVTDALIRIGEIAAQGCPEWQETIPAIRAQHLAILTALTTTTIPGATSEITPRFDAAWKALEADLARLSPSARPAEGGAQPADIARFSAWGERLSTLLFTLALRAEGTQSAAFVGEPVVAAARRDIPASEPQPGEGPWARLAPS